MRRISLLLLVAVLAFAGSAAAQIVLQGEITQDMTLTSNNTYLLRGGVFVGNDVDETVLTIEAGTTILGESSTYGMLVIRRGSRIEANGTVDAPIVFTSNQVNPSRSDWGGLIINGRAHLNVPGGEAEGEGSTGFYGGGLDPDDADNSGTLRYVRVEYAGREISPDNELNGIAFQGVGNGTTVEYCQVHFNKDDGFEWFGGSVDVKYLYSSGNADDSFDWTEGWNGRGQFMTVKQFPDDADQGIEADNNGEDNDALPRAHPTLYNLTLIGAQNDDNGESDIGMLLREGTAANIYNAIVMEFGDAGIDIDQEATFLNAWDAGNSQLSGELTVDYSFFYGNNDTWQTGESDEPNFPFTTEEFITTLNANNTIGSDPMLTDPYTLVDPAFYPMDGSPVIGAGVSAPNDGFFTTGADYVGAFNVDENWLYGWALPGTAGPQPGAITQDIALVGNRFELVSFNVLPDMLDASDVFDLDNLNIVQNDNGQIYWPAININTIGDVDVTEGYRVYNAENETLSVNGTPLAADTDYTLVAGPWNFIGYPFAFAVDLEVALADILANVVAVQDDDGNLYYPDFGITDLQTLQPGTGYQIIVDGDVTFQFNDGI